MLYPKNQNAKLEDSLFQNPTAEYRGAPFWAWNNKLDKDQLCRQIENMKQMGFGGYHMHVRTGLDTPYLSDEFMDAITCCVEKGKQEQMLSWLYDEDRWPSGHAGGMVTEDRTYAKRMLVFSPEPPQDGEILCAYDIVLDEDGCLAESKIIGKDETAKGTKWYAAVRVAKGRNDCNGNPYVDTMNPEAIRRFSRITHERYKEVIGKEFGTAVPAIFSDEPSHDSITFLSFAGAQKPVRIPWTHDLAETFHQACGMDLLTHLPEFFWQMPGNTPSRFRWLLHDHITERFAGAFADTLGNWCRENGLMLTGHMLGEGSLTSQTKGVGECMRHYRSFQLPGIDMLCNAYEYSTAKQAQSAARQYGREGVMSELYGVTGWHFDFRGHKLQGDWQAALGITVRVPHLYWVSMAGEAKRDYPAAIGHQSPWWTEYSYIEDHFARLNTALTRGKPICKIGVIHPIESYWLSCGPQEQTSQQQQALNTNFKNILDWLLMNQQDMDFIAESLLPDLCKQGANPLPVGEMEYDVIILPGLKTIRSTTLQRLIDFEKAGGKVLIVGGAPTLVDAAPSEALQQLKGQLVPMDCSALLDALEENRLVDVRTSGSFKIDDYNSQVGNKGGKAGARQKNIIYQLRQDGNNRWLFLCHGAPVSQLDTTYDEPVQIRIRGTWKPTLYNTLSGEITPVGATYDGKWTYIEWVLHPCDSLLFRLEEGEAAAPVPTFATDRTGTALMGMVPVTLHEPNVLLLDIAQYRMDDDARWQAAEEVLRLDSVCRQRLGYSERNDTTLQPWVLPKEPISHTIHLKFEFHSDLELKGTQLALEDAETAVITMNGETVESTVTGTYVDECIKTVALPTVKQGKNVITVSMPFGKRTNTEALYLLGDFGVKVFGTYRTLTTPVREVGFGSITDQGLPYYGGNITYHLPLESTEDMELGICHYRGSLMNVSAGGKFMGRIVFPPYRLPLRDIPKDAKTVDVTLFGNRHNTFGPLHNFNPATTWWGPTSGRSQRDAWGYEYNLRPFGILSGPVVKKL